MKFHLPETLLQYFLMQVVFPEFELAYDLNYYYDVQRMWIFHEILCFDK